MGFGNVVSAYLHVFRTDADLILIVALVLVQRIVLVDVLYVGVCLVRRVVALCPLIAVRRVALWHIDALVAVEDAGLLLVIVRASEVVVVVVGRVVVPGCTHAVVDGDFTQEVGIGVIRTFLLVVQTVQSDVLQCT